MRGADAQVADLEVELTHVRAALRAADRAATPDVVHLKSLLCDPAVAHEFTLLREENRALQTEVRRQGDLIQGLQSKPSDPVRARRACSNPRRRGRFACMSRSALLARI